MLSKVLLQAAAKAARKYPLKDSEGNAIQWIDAIQYINGRQFL